MEFGAFHSESCFPARRNPVCPSFVPLAVLRLDGLATGVGQMRRDSEGDKRGRERDSESHKERRRESKRSREERRRHVVGDVYTSAHQRREKV